MIGTMLYQNRLRVRFFIIMYGLLAFIGSALIAVSLSRNQDPSGAAGFMLIFGAGMAFLTWSKSRKPRVSIREEYLEVNQQRRMQLVRYKNISNVTRKDNRLVIAVHEGHDIKYVTIWLKDLETADAEKLSEFCLKKGWKGR